MAWKDAVELNKLQEEGRLAEIIDGHKILFIWDNNTVYAISSQCPHFKLSLTRGKITEENSIICPFHKSAFDLSTGEVQCWSPWPKGIGKMLGKFSKPKKLRIYSTRIEENKIAVSIE